MKSPNITWTLTSLAAAALATLVLLNSSLGANPVGETKPGQPPAGDLATFSALAPIDAHAHVFKDDPAFASALKQLNLHILDICVVDKHDRGYEEAAPQNQMARKILHSTGGRAAWCSTFDRKISRSPDSRSNRIRS